MERCLEGSVLPAHVGQPIVGAIALSMLAGPILAQFSDSILADLRLEREVEEDDGGDGSSVQPQELQGHVVLAGCGPVGRLVALTLEGSGVRYVAIERDVERLQRARRDGHNVMFGDATRPGILRAAGIEQASTMVVLINDWHRSAKIIRDAKRLNPMIQVIAGQRDDAHLGDLARAGASHIFPENFAAGLGLAAQALMSLGVPPAEAMDRIRAIRAELNPELRLLPA